MSSEAWIRAQRLALLEHAAASLRKNRIEAEVVPNAQRLLERLEQLVPQTASASSGGSVTLEQTGVLNGSKQAGEATMRETRMRRTAGHGSRSSSATTIL